MVMKICPKWKMDSAAELPLKHLYVPLGAHPRSIGGPSGAHPRSTRGPSGAIRGPFTASSAALSIFHFAQIFMTIVIPP